MYSNGSNSDGSTSGEYYLMPRVVRPGLIKGVPIVVYEKVMALEHPKMDQFWFLKVELERGGGFRKLIELVGKIYSPLVDPPGFFIPGPADEKGKVTQKYCYILDDKKGLLCMWNHDMPNNNFWFLRYVLRIGEIATFEDLNDLLLYQEERYMR